MARRVGRAQCARARAREAAEAAAERTANARLAASAFHDTRAAHPLGAAADEAQGEEQAAWRHYDDDWGGGPTCPVCDAQVSSVCAMFLRT